MRSNNPLLERLRNTQPSGIIFRRFHVTAMLTDSGEGLFVQFEAPFFIIEDLELYTDLFTVSFSNTTIDNIPALFI